MTPLTEAQRARLREALQVIADARGVVDDYAHDTAHAALTAGWAASCGCWQDEGLVLE